MRRRELLIGAGAAVAALIGRDASACGDKFLRPGRGAGGNRFQSLYPSAILVYTPAAATAKGMVEFEAMLKQAGHTPRIVGRDADLAPIFAKATFEVVIADYADAAAIRRQVDPLKVPTIVLPVLQKPTKAVESEARKAYRCLIRPNAMTKHDARREIDRAIDLVRNGSRT